MPEIFKYLQPKSCGQSLTDVNKKGKEASFLKYHLKGENND